MSRCRPTEQSHFLSLYFSKALDTVSHIMLITKLLPYGLDGPEVVEASLDSKTPGTTFLKSQYWSRIYLAPSSTTQIVGQCAGCQMITHAREWLMLCRDGLMFRGTSWGMATEVVWMLEYLIHTKRLHWLGLFCLEKRKTQQESNHSLPVTAREQYKSQGQALLRAAQNRTVVTSGNRGNFH